MLLQTTMTVFQFLLSAIVSHLADCKPRVNEQSPEVLCHTLHLVLCISLFWNMEGINWGSDIAGLQLIFQQFAIEPMPSELGTCFTVPDRQRPA